MKNLKENLISSLLIIISLVAFSIFRSIPQAKLWKGYSVMYVPVNASSKSVLSALDENNVKDYIALENQYVPLQFSKETPEISLALSRADKSTYLRERALYFFDRNHLFRIYYIPENQNNALENTVKLLASKYNICAGVNISSSYPFIVPLICIAFAFLLISYSDEKMLTSFVSILPVIFSFSFPFYGTSVSVCFLLYLMYLYTKFWKRSESFNYIIKNVIFLVFGAFSVVIMFFTGFKYGLFYLLLCISEISCIKLSKTLIAKKDERYNLKTVSIIPAKLVSIYTKKSVFCLSCLSLCVCITLMFVMLSSKISIGTSTPKESSSITLPGANGSFGKLPDLNDYVLWSWETLTFPYISVNNKKEPSKPSKGDKISFTEYSELDGKIITSEKSIVYNSDFSDKMINEIDDLKFPAVEKLIKMQGSVRPGYTTGSSQSITKVTIFAIILSLCTTLIFYCAAKTKFKKYLVLRGLK